MFQIRYAYSISQGRTYGHIHGVKDLRESKSRAFIALVICYR